MISALRKLQQAHEPSRLPEQMQAFGINTGGIGKLFSTHPPLEKRIEALEREI